MFILSITVWKFSSLHFFSICILYRETFTFLSLIVFSILDHTDLLTAFPFGNKDGTASGLSIYCKLPQRRHCFSSWLSSNESLVKWSEDPWIALGKTGLLIALIQASLISFLLSPGIYDMKHFCSILIDLNNLSRHTSSDHFCFIKSSLC